MDRQYDVAILGVWYGLNYGSVLTYYALHEVLKQYKPSILMIPKLDVKKNDIEMDNSHSMAFVKKHFNISDAYNYDNASDLNKIVDTFIIGSDQVWNYGISKGFRKSFYLDFVDDSHRKISYAASFGHAVDFTPPDVLPKLSDLLKRFHAISVREADGVRICRDQYGVKAEQVLDPVFLYGKDGFLKLIKDMKPLEPQPFLLNYILDPSDEKTKAAEYIAEKKGLKIVSILDGFHNKFDDNKKKLGLDNVVENPSVEEFLWYFANADFILTDSFHGTSFSIIFNKDFISLGNRGRGISRFNSLFNTLKMLKHRFTLNPQKILENDTFFESIDFVSVNEIIDFERYNSAKWLEKALNYNVETQPKEQIPIMENKLHPDIERCAILVSLVKEYGIKHIILSSGTRNLSIVRYFEANQNFFKLYHVTDERSAGYFAIGLATKLNETVAICCTSGTAVSNYVPPVTEAFHQRVPLLVITADRHPSLSGHMEDQTIVQYGLFDTICKKCVTLPVNNDRRSMWDARLRITNAILEINHHGSGPVQINVPIDHIERLPPSPSTLRLPKLRKIERLTVETHEAIWKEAFKKFSNSKRIMILCGQNMPLNNSKLELLNNFSEYCNSIILVDPLANVRGNRVFHFSKLLSKMSQDEFNKDFSPDLVITFGGRFLMNSPIFPKLKGSKKCELWRVAEDGELADPFRQLCKVFECSDEYFINYFMQEKTANDIIKSLYYQGKSLIKGIINGENSFNKGERYFNLWKSKIDGLPSENITEYKTYYTLQETMKNIPEKSLIHIGVGNTFFHVRYFPYRDDIEIFCNMGVNGIDGCTSSFMGQVAATTDDRLCFLLIGDLSFFYDMNALWNKELKRNIRILLNNDSGAGLLRHHRSSAITQAHATTAEGWVKSLGFKYLSAVSKEEFDNLLPEFLSKDSKEPIFFEVFLPEGE